MRKRINMHRLQEMVRLRRLGTGKRETARLLGMSPNTERRYRDSLDEAGLLDGDADDLPSLETLRAAIGPATLPTQQMSSVAGWRFEIEKLAKKGAGPQAIHDHLKTESDKFTGSLSAVKRMCRQFAREQGVRADEVAIPVETAAGEVAQVDFGYVGLRYDPETKRLRKAHAFVMVLGFSRHMFARIVFDQKIDTWLQLHVDAFKWFAAVPRVVVPDNLKSAVIRATFGVGESVLNRSYRELARHYGFKIDPTPPRTPQQKGKVESGVKYVKRNFMMTVGDDDNVVVTNKKLAIWTENIAGMRIHGSTGKRPYKVFIDEEHAAMLPLRDDTFEPVTWGEPMLGRDCRFAFGGAHYSAPWRLVGQRMMVRATASELLVFSDDERVATHPRVAAGKSSIQDKHLPPGRREYRHRAPEYWYERALAVAPSVEAWSREVMASDDVLSKIGVLQSSIPFLESLGAKRSAAVCARASFYGAYKFPAIKRIVTKNLDTGPLPIDIVIPDDETITSPRFARDIRELLQLPVEEMHEPN